MATSDQFENYELLRRADGSIHELGRGAMGVTYKARDIDLHCDVALKVINPGIITGPEAQERFLREARAAAQFRHPNIASVFRLGRSDDGTHFYAMEFCEGPTLEQAVTARGHFTTEEALRITLQVSKALMLAEQLSMVHRDLKPANLILTESHDEGTVVKVIDFGLAKSFAAGMQTLATTSSGGFAGTAQFASPEQLEELELDTRSDIYSLGVCLWFMLVGNPPFQGSLARVMSQTLSAEPPWEQLNGQPPDVIELLQSMVAKHREDRPAGAAVLRAEVEACLSTDGHQSRGAAAPSPSAEMEVTDQNSFLERYRPTESLGSDALGRLFRGSDVVRQGAEVTVRVIDPSMTAVPALRRTLLAQLEVAKRNPHPNLLSPLDFVLGEDGLLIALDWTDGFNVLDLLRQRGVIQPGEACQLLSSLAPGADHAERCGVEGLNLSKDQVVIYFMNPLDKPNRTQLLSMPVGDWPQHVVRAGTFSLDDAGHFQREGIASMATIAPTSSVRGHALSSVLSLAHLACELLGGKGGAAFTPVSKLSEAGNSLLRRAFSDPGSFSSGADLIAQLQASLGNVQPFPGKPKVPVAMPVAARKPTKTPSKSNPVLVGVISALLLAGLGAGYYFGIHQPRERDRKERAKVADSESGKGSETVVSQAPGGMTGGRSPSALERGMAQGNTGQLAGADSAGNPRESDGEETVLVPEPEEWEALAAKGDPFAQSLLAEKLLTAPEVAKEDGEKALGLLAQAAAKKHPLAVFLLTEQRRLKRESDRLRGEDVGDDRSEIEGFDNAFKLGFGKGASTGGVAWEAALGRAYRSGLGVSEDKRRAANLMASTGRKGHLWSQFAAGELYATGRGVPADLREAKRWFEMAADTGFPPAQAALARLLAYAPAPIRDEGQAHELADLASKAGISAGMVILAECLEFGIGTDINPLKALPLYEKAAEEGNLDGKAHMGRVYYEGKLVTSDYSKALNLLKKAYAGGNFKVCSLLGSMYEDGKSGETSISTALKYYRAGAAEGDVRSKALLAVCTEEGRGMPADLAAAVSLYREAAAGGVAEAQFRLGVMSMLGTGVRRDERAGAGYLRQAAEQGFNPAKLEWGKCLERGFGVPKDEREAFRYYTQAAKSGKDEASFRVNLLLEEGRGVVKDEQSAAAGYEALARKGYAPAQVNLGLMLAQGRGVAKNEVKALEWYGKAEAQNDVDAMVLCGMMHEFGLGGTPRSNKDASRYYRRAADKGDAQAAELLKKADR